MHALEAKARELRGAVAGHKAAIRRHRAGLAQAKAQLVALEAECARRGIRLVIEGEGGETHGREEGTRTGP